MAAYTYRSWETINLPAVTGNTNFIIYTVATSTPGDTLSNIIYSGLIIDGYGLSNLEEILSQYVRVEEIIFDSSNPTLLQDDEQSRTFFIYYTQDDWETWTRDTVTVTYDWTYAPVIRRKSAKITNILDYRQYAVYSFMSRDGTEEPVAVTFGTATIDNFTIEGDSTYTYIMPLSNLNYSQGLVGGTSYRYTVANSVYYIMNTCYKYALYYLNEYGGYDYMLFGGRELEKDGLSRLSYKKNYVAQDDMSRNKVDYLTNISEAWSLNTSWLTDSQSEKMISLLATNRAWLHNLETGELFTVNITNSTCEHKTYKNQGRKFYSYTVEVEASKPKYRI